MGNRRIKSRFRWLVRVASLGSFSLLLGVAPVATPSANNSQKQGPSHADQYVGSQACATCHKEIYAKYLQTGMGRSVVQVTPEWLRGQPTSGSVEDKNNQLQFETYAQHGKLYQTEHQTGSDGREIFRDTHELEWIIGAGENGFGALLRQNGYLFQAPLSFYSKPGRWSSRQDMSLAI